METHDPFEHIRTGGGFDAPAERLELFELLAALVRAERGAPQELSRDRGQPNVDPWAAIDAADERVENMSGDELRIAFSDLRTATTDHLDSCPSYAPYATAEQPDSALPPARLAAANLRAAVDNLNLVVGIPGADDNGALELIARICEAQAELIEAIDLVAKS